MSYYIYDEGFHEELERQHLAQLDRLVGTDERLGDHPFANQAEEDVELEALHKSEEEERSNH